MSYELTREGHARVDAFLAECRAKKKKILDANKDTAAETGVENG